VPNSESLGDPQPISSAQPQPSEALPTPTRTTVTDSEQITQTSSATVLPISTESATDETGPHNGNAADIKDAGNGRNDANLNQVQSTTEKPTNTISNDIGGNEKPTSADLRWWDLLKSNMQSTDRQQPTAINLVALRSSEAVSVVPSNTAIIDSTSPETSDDAVLVTVRPLSAHVNLTFSPSSTLLVMTSTIRADARKMVSSGVSASPTSTGSVVRSEGDAILAVDEDQQTAKSASRDDAAQGKDRQANTWLSPSAFISFQDEMPTSTSTALRPTDAVLEWESSVSRAGASQGEGETGGNRSFSEVGTSSNAGPIDSVTVDEARLGRHTDGDVVTATSGLRGHRAETTAIETSIDRSVQRGQSTASSVTASPSLSGSHDAHLEFEEVVKGREIERERSSAYASRLSGEPHLGTSSAVVRPTITADPGGDMVNTERHRAEVPETSSRGLTYSDDLPSSSPRRSHNADVDRDNNGPSGGWLFTATSAPTTTPEGETKSSAAVPSQAPDSLEKRQNDGKCASYTTATSFVTTTGNPTTTYAQVLITTSTVRTITIPTETRYAVCGVGSSTRTKAADTLGTSLLRASIDRVVAQTSVVGESCECSM
jgi:hypothetical protein